MLGIYEKALPVDVSWQERLTIAKDLGFDFVEMSIDESDARLARLDWQQPDLEQVRQAIVNTGIPVLSLCLSGHRRYPLGSLDARVRQTALQMMEQSIRIASYLGIRDIQLAGYDVYYEQKSPLTREYFIEDLRKCVAMAAKHCVMLSIETMDDPFINSLQKIQLIKRQIHSPWLQAYPDIGNISAWPENDLGTELELGIGNIAQVHLKDTKNVTTTSDGQFKNVPFGEGDVDFVGALRTLRRLGYHGPYMIEMWSGENSADPVSEVRKAKKFITQQFELAEVQDECLKS